MGRDPAGTVQLTLRVVEGNDVDQLRSRPRPHVPLENTDPVHQCPGRDRSGGGPADGTICHHSTGSIEQVFDPTCQRRHPEETTSNLWETAPDGVPRAQDVLRSVLCNLPAGIRVVDLAGPCGAWRKT